MQAGLHAAPRVTKAPSYARNTTAVKGKSSPSFFITKLTNILQDSSTKTSSTKYISWNLAGDTIIVSNETNFSQNELPKYFKHNNFASFVRQLNTYGFSKTSTGFDRSEYKNPNFKKGQPELTHAIKRKTMNCPNCKWVGLERFSAVHVASVLTSPPE